MGGPARENMIAFAKSANDRLTARDLLAAKCGLPFVLNPSPARLLPAPLPRQVDTLIPNEHEALLMTGEKDVARAGKKLLEQG